MDGRNANAFGGFIASRRQAMRLTQEELAGRVGVSKSAIAKWETGGGLPERDNLRRLSQCLNVSVEDLYRIIDGAEKNSDSGADITQDVVAVLESYGYRVIKPGVSNEINNATDKYHKEDEDEKSR